MTCRHCAHCRRKRDKAARNEERNVTAYNVHISGYAVRGARHGIVAKGEKVSLERSLYYSPDLHIYTEAIPMLLFCLTSIKDQAPA